ncbi:aldo/keto reductase [Mucilaginibacter pedocola]|uniref:aldo/keto reductase n=1 Tax=Mucilaginibacter pedocola TaxID=1792845 RepID=UPI000992B806|nr:aldo/keto reductase [Mucilaginibacter pedocola]
METHFQRNQTRYRPLTRLGLGGVAIGNGFRVNDDRSAYETMEAAWTAGIRYYDTSPLYGMGISEHRMGVFLANKPKHEYTLSSKVGRILYPHENFDVGQNIWKGNHNFGYRYDYTASGTRRSIEDTLQRMGVSSLDIVFIHDISPENVDMNENWVEYFKAAQQGAMPELTKMREEGIIKGWGIGVNRLEPILRTLEVADPDIFLSATQYSLIHHECELNKVFPLCADRGISVVVGAPLNAGFLAGKPRYNYGNEYPRAAAKKLGAIRAIAERHDVSLLSAALQFSAAPDVVSAIIPGAHNPEQVKEIVASVNCNTIPPEFWEELKMEGLIADNAPVPVAMLQ